MALNSSCYVLLSFVRYQPSLRRTLSRLRRSYSLFPGSNMAEPMRTYDHALELLNSLQSNRLVVQMVQDSGRDMNLVAIQEMIDWVRKAGYEVKDFNKLKVIHVSGTKGKGSVCAMVASILEQYSVSQNSAPITSDDVVKTSNGWPNQRGQAGLGKIGLYTSPHLVSVRERICINSVPISRSLFATHFFTLWDRYSAVAAATGHSNPTGPETKPSYFRYLTIMALHVFLQEGVETVVVECGIGGEYDSTNILSNMSVVVAAISKLGIDHIGMLGDNIQAIAWHKAGIMKEGVTCFTVAQADEAMQVLHERSIEKKAILNVVSRNAEVDHGNVPLALEGDFQKDNASLAIAAANYYLKKMGLRDAIQSNKLPAEFRIGLAKVRWAGRCETVIEENVEWYIDGAHTAESLEATAKWFASKLHRDNGHNQAMLIFNQQERDVTSLISRLHETLEKETGTKQIFSQAVFCTNKPFRGKDQKTSGMTLLVDDLWVQRAMAGAWEAVDDYSTISIHHSIEDAVEYARSISKNGQKLQVLVTGSLHLVGGILTILGRNETAF